MATTIETLEARLNRLEQRVDAVEQVIDRPVPSRRVGLTVKEVRAALRTPVESRPEDLDRLRQIFGRFEGPGDLSENFRDYYYGERS